MPLDIATASFTAGFAYAVTPGPGVLALLGIGARQGRSAGARFLAGHMAGDVVWVGLALVAILGAHSVGEVVFDIIGLACAAYLGWLGLRALLYRGAGRGTSIEVRRPLLHGAVFGLTNPKGYPVAVAMFTALLATASGSLGWGQVGLLMAAAMLGICIGYGLLVAGIGAAAFRRFYARHELWIVRASGLLFLGFAVNASLAAAPGLVRRLRG